MSNALCKINDLNPFEAVLGAWTESESVHWINKFCQSNKLLLILLNLFGKVNFVHYLLKLLKGV